MPPFAELFVACALLTGCTTDEYARQLIQQDTGVGKIREALTGTSEQLVRSGTISAARRYSMPDGTEIDVWIVKATAGEPRGTVLVLHGLRDSKVTYKRLAQMLSGKGFDVVLPDLRAHGHSTGRYVTYGALEKHDQKHVIDELFKERLIAEPVYVFGASVGASVAIQYAAMEPRVRGVMAMAPARDMRLVLPKAAAAAQPPAFREGVGLRGRDGAVRPGRRIGDGRHRQAGLPGAAGSRQARRRRAARRQPGAVRRGARAEGAGAGTLGRPPPRAVRTGKQDRGRHREARLRPGGRGDRSTRRGGWARTGQRRRPIARAWRPAR